MIAQTHDLGSNNNTLAEAMNIRIGKHCDDHNEVFKWDHKRHRVRCVCHKLALIVSGGLQALGIQAPPPPLVKSTMLGDFPIPTTTLQSVPEEDETFEGGLEGGAAINEEDYDEVDDSDLQPATESSDWYGVIDGPHEPHTVSTEPLASNRNAANAVDSLMTKLDVIGRKIGGSAVMCNLFDAVSQTLLSQKLPRPIPGYGIQWNIKLQCWKRLYNAREVIDQILKEDQMEVPRRAGSSRVGETPLPPDVHRPRGVFNKIMISPDEWRQVRDLINILQEFESLTKFFEQNGPTGSLVIREYVKLRKTLQKKIDATLSRAKPLFPMYHAMLVQVKAYLKEALDSHTLILATILHPSLRLDYFEFAFGEASEETLLAKELIKSAYSDKKTELEIDGPYEPITANSNRIVDGKSLVAAEDDEEFRKHKAKNRKNTANELRSYLEMAEDPAPEVSENPHLALEWWKLNESKYPILSCLACDYLAISGTSCAVERCFSCAADICTRDRSSLKPRPIERLVCGRMWSVEGVQMKGKYCKAGEIMNQCISNDSEARARVKRS